MIISISIPILLSTIANGYLANKKNRNVILWFLLGLFIPVLSTILLFFLSKEEPLK